MRVMKQGISKYLSRRNYRRYGHILLGQFPPRAGRLVAAIEESGVRANPFDSTADAGVVNQSPRDVSKIGGQAETIMQEFRYQCL